MITLYVQFEGANGIVRKRAMLTNDLQHISANRSNQCVDLIDDFRFSDGFWSLLFDGNNGLSYELKLIYDIENGYKTLEPIEMLIWSDGVILDSSNVTIKIKY